MEKKKTTLNLDNELMKFIKLKALDLDITITDLITLYLKYGLIHHNKIKNLTTERDYQRKLKRWKHQN